MQNHCKRDNRAILQKKNGDMPHIKTMISTTLAPAAIGPYSQAVRVGDTLYTSGQVALDPATGALVSGGIREQTSACSTT